MRAAGSGADDEVSVTKGPAGTRLVLPARTLPAPLRRAAWLLFAVSSLMAVHGGDLCLAAAAGGGGLGPALEVALSLPGLAVALLLLASRATLELAEGQLVVRDGIGPLIVKRCYERAAIGRFAVELLRMNGVPEAVPSVGALPPEGIPVLTAEVRGCGRRVLAFGYTQPQLECVRRELTLWAGLAVVLPKPPPEAAAAAPARPVRGSD